MLRPPYVVPDITAVQELHGRGPWASKSGGALNVLFALEAEVATTRFLHYEETELAASGDIRGLRGYSVSAIPEGSIGGREWHRVRNELVFAVRGHVQWTCEDVHGNISVQELRPGTGVWVPPFVLHTYLSLEEDSELLIIANTLFNPDDPRTHDTFNEDLWAEIRSEYA